VIKINKAGWIYIILTLLIGFSAVNTGNNLIYIMASALLSYMLVSGIFGRQNLHGLAIELEIPEEIYAGTEIPIGIRLINQRRLMPAFLIRVLIEDRQVLFAYTGAKSEDKSYCTFDFKVRGEHVIGSIYVCSVFPFNFFTRFRKIHQAFRLIVFPKPKKCGDLPAQDRQARIKGDASTLAIGFDSDIISIRDYSSGDPLKYISWKSTAKTGVLKTKELSAIELQQVLIDFDRMDKRDLEHSLSCVTFLVLKFIRSNIPVGLVIQGEHFKPAVSKSHKINLLRKLALYDQN
jgi:uncharacterized protein (DUF58 family)